MRTSLQVNPHLYMSDITGRPLDYGKVYFGEPNKDPEFYPINIFYDEGLTIPASQPVRTKGGFLNANGDMCEIYAAEIEYSVKVLDKYDRQVFYKPKLVRSNTDNSVSTRLNFYGSVTRTQADKNAENISVVDFKSSTNTWTDAFSAAKATGKKIKVPKGKYQLGKFDFADCQWEFETGAILRNEDDSSYWGGGINGSWATEQTSFYPTSQNRITSPSYIYVENSSNYSSIEKRNDVMTYNNWVDRFASNAYDVVATGLTSYMQYGLRKAAQGENASGSVSAISPIIQVFAADSISASNTGRSEITPIATGLNCASNYNQVNSNFYNDFCVAGPISDKEYYREGFLAGASFYVRKYAPGNGIDNDMRGHDGSYGIAICSVPRGGGFQGENITTRTYPIKAGVSIVGWSGLPSTVNANDSNADNGFDVGIQIGGYGGSVWMPASAKTTRTTKVSYGVTIEDWVYGGILISNKHPSAGRDAPAIKIAQNSGGIQIDNFYIFKNDNGLTIYDQSSNATMLEIKNGRIYMNLPDAATAVAGTLCKDSSGVVKVK